MVFRVALIEFAHESNTFTVKTTGIQDFQNSRYVRGAEMLEQLRNTTSEIGGAIGAAVRMGWDVVPILAAHANPSGPVCETARRKITDEARRLLAECGPLDGVFIALHGAMVTETDQDGESQFLREIRAAIGVDIPVAVTLDLHANIFDEFAEHVQIAVSYRTYPHVDMAARAGEACDLLHRAMGGEIKPSLLVDRPPMLLGCDDGRTTDDGPMCHVLEAAAEEAQAPGLLHVSVNAGFTDSDVFAAGPSVLVCHDNAEAAAAQTARRLCDLIWSFRDDWTLPMSLDEAIAKLKGHKLSSKPVVVADFSDNPGGGGYGDCTALLSALLEAGIENAALGALIDAQAAETLSEAGVGGVVTLSVGGKSDPSAGGGPLELTGEVRAVSDGTLTFKGPMLAGVAADMGPSVCFRVAGVDVLITSNALQMHDLNQFRCVGIEPMEKNVLVVKSMQHFRAAFEPIASEVLVVDAGGLCSPDVTRRHYERLRRPVFPLDQIDA
ncbi:M81 family metallopeptidase [Aestuariivita boseongensis]|uniref:M81 family metallopeptidase n=1 Tax=Aestuariivita boseongensis TaxID=1470562 RepID=UPI00068301D6|nr:M81 family metallopeptidase [Aestuariivita boseongensis]